MTKFYFVRHGEEKYEEANTKIYQNFGINMLTLSEKGISQIKNTSKDERLKKCQIIITSPFGRALHSAAILSKELGIDIIIETDLHEWVADKNYKYLNDEDAYKAYKEFKENNGIKNSNCRYNYEDTKSIKNRVSKVLDKYKDYENVIVVCHSVVIGSFLDIKHPNHGDIVEYTF